MVLRSIVIICVVIVGPVLPVMSLAQFVDTNTALKIEKQYLNRRYDGYYKHVEAYREYQKIRVRKVKDHKISRDKFEKQLEVKRKAFIKKRKKIKKVEVDIDAIVAKQQRVRDKARNKKRLKYIKNRKIMENLRKTTKKIPIDVDVGLKSLGQNLKK